MEGTHELCSTLGVCLVGRLKNRLKSRVYEASRGIKTGGDVQTEKAGEKKGKSRKKQRGGERKYCLPRLALYPPFTTSLLFVQMPNGLLCESQGFRLMWTLVLFPERPQLQSVRRIQSRSYTTFFVFYLNRKNKMFHIFSICYELGY